MRRAITTTWLCAIIGMPAGCGGFSADAPPAAEDGARRPRGADPPPPVLAPPRVVSTRPGSGSSSASTETTLGATFSEQMQCATLDEVSFTVRSGKRLIPGTVSCAGATATFAPDEDLPPDALLTATVSASAKNFLGQPMFEPFDWTFHTGAGPLAPAVISTSPRRSQTSVDRRLQIRVVFSAVLDPASVTPATFRVTRSGAPVEGALGYGGGAVTFTPAGGPLEPLTTYEVQLAGLTNAARQPLAQGVSWSFTTGAAGR